MKVNLIVDDKNIIRGIIISPLSSEFPTVNIGKVEDIHVGFDKYIKKKIVKDDVAYETSQKKSAILAKIAQLKALLEQTDYEAIKYAEGQLSESEYAEMKQQRKEYRDKINKLEESLSSN